MGPVMTGTLQRSRYNSFVRRADGIVGFNARTGTFAVFSAAVAAWLDSTGQIPDSPGDDDVAALVEMGFLHRGDELQLIAERYFGHPSAARHLTLTLAPTMACNRSCSYCYQNEYRTSHRMSSETQEAVCRLAAQEVGRGRTQVRCTWFGGEPLLATDIVLDLSRRLRHRIEQAGGTFLPMTIITNGVLLDEATARALADAGVARAQISFDTLIDDRTDRRGVIQPDGRPSIILRNAITAASILELGIRLNVTRSTTAEMARILEVLREHKLEDRLSLARAEDFDGEAGALTAPSGTRYKPDRKIIPLIQRDADILSRVEFARHELAVDQTKPGFLDEVQQRLTPPSGGFCGATNGTMLVIDPDGDISRCWNSAGVKSESIGNVNAIAPTPEQLEAEHQWSGYTPFRYASCESCRVLPLCRGGCSHPRLFAGAQSSPCESIKFVIGQYVEFVGSRIELAAEEVTEEVACE
jgi:uncharacterized protein